MGMAVGLTPIVGQIMTEKEAVALLGIVSSTVIGKGIEAVIWLRRKKMTGPKITNDYITAFTSDFEIEAKCIESCLFSHWVRHHSPILKGFALAVSPRHFLRKCSTVYFSTMRCSSATNLVH
jgi:hypothetical protein